MESYQSDICRFIAMTLLRFQLVVNWPVFGRPFVKRFALCYRTVVLSVWLSVTVGCIKVKLSMHVGLGHGQTGIQLPREQGTVAPPPLFGPCLLWPRSPISATAELLLPYAFAVLLVCIANAHLYLTKIFLNRLQ